MDVMPSWTECRFYPTARCLLQTARTYPPAPSPRRPPRPWPPLSSPKDTTTPPVRAMLRSSATRRTPASVASTLLAYVPLVTEAPVSAKVEDRLHTVGYPCPCISAHRCSRILGSATVGTGTRFTVINNTTVLSPSAVYEG